MRRRLDKEYALKQQDADYKRINNLNKIAIVRDGKVIGWRLYTKSDQPFGLQKFYGYKWAKRMRKIAPRKINGICPRCEWQNCQCNISKLNS